MVDTPNTYNSFIELALGNVPNEIEDPILYRELLDIHNALEGLVIFTGGSIEDVIQFITVVNAEVSRVRALTTELKKKNDDLEQSATLIASEVARALALSTKLKKENANLEQTISSVAALNASVRAKLNAHIILLDAHVVVFDAHIASTSAHGVTGSNIGTEDFATESVGGAVKLSDLLADASTSSNTVGSADAGSAPPTYNATQIDTIVTLANDCKATINAFVVNDYNNFIGGKFNSLLSKMKTAKQMNTT